VKAVFVTSPVTGDLGREPWDGVERRGSQRRMGIGRRTGGNRRETAPSSDPGAYGERRLCVDRRSSAERRRCPDRRIGLGRTIDLSGFGL